MTYRDMTFCNAKDCRNMDCPLNYKHIPLWKLPKDTLISVSDLHKDCEDYTEKEDE